MTLNSCLPTVTTLMLAFLLLVNQGGPSSAGRPQLFWVAADKAQCSNYSSGSDCDTLDGYWRRYKYDVNFSLSDTTWIFLHGEHEWDSGESSLKIVGARNVTLKGDDNCALEAKKCTIVNNIFIKQSNGITLQQLRLQTGTVVVIQTSNFYIHSVDFLSTSMLIKEPFGSYTLMKSSFRSLSGYHLFATLHACPSTSEVNCNFTFIVEQCSLEMEEYPTDDFRDISTGIIVNEKSYYHYIKIAIINSTFINSHLHVLFYGYPIGSLDLGVQNVTFNGSIMNFRMPLVENMIYPEVAGEWLGAYVLVKDCNFMGTNDQAMAIGLIPSWFQDSYNQGRVVKQHPEIVISHSNFRGGVYVFFYIIQFQLDVQITFPNEHTLHEATNRTLLTILHSTFKRARQGAALHLHHLQGYKVTLAEGNRLISNEGFGLLLNRTQIELHGYNEISGNKFTRHTAGGGIYLSSDSQLLLAPHSLLNVSADIVDPYGGVLYNSYKGRATQTLNEFVDCYVDKLTCPGWCFFQLIDSDGQYMNVNDIPQHNATVILPNNTTSLGGNNVFNGHFQNCSLQTAHGTIPASKELILNIFLHYLPMDKELTPSFPYAICFCDSIELNCGIRNHTLVIKTYPVKEFTSFVTVVGDWQHEIAVSLTVALPQLGTEYKLDIKGCSKVHTLEHPNEPPPGSRYELSLKASFRNSDAELQRIIAIHFFNDCSPGLEYKHASKQCECNPFLEQHHFTCTITNNKTTYRAEQSHYWIGIKDEHAILSPSCPIFFCNSVLQSGLTLDNSTIDSLQCSHGRQGLLCSECPSGYSSVFGSFTCKECSSVWLLQLPLYALGGIFIVALLFLFNLTLLQGTIMGVVLYTNIMGLMGDFLQEHAWGPLFFLLSVLSLQPAAGVCFYSGMDEFWKALLQFALPFYVFILLIVIIIVTHKCGYRMFRKARFIARRAVPVLATIMVLTYTSLVNAVITPLRYTTLYNADTAQGQTVWLHQPSLPFFGGQHLVLGILSIAVTVLYLIPFTFTMLFGDLMRRYFHKLWFSHFMDVLHGGFKWPLGFWIGLRLLIRVILMVVNISTNPNTPTFSAVVTAGTLLVVQLLVKPFRDPNQFREDIHIQGPPSCKRMCLTWMKKFFNMYHAPLFDTLYLFNIALTSAMVSFGTNSQTVVLSVAGVNILILLALVQFAVILVYHAYNFFPVPERARSCVQSCWSTMRAIPSMLKDTQCCRRGPREEEEPRRSSIPILILQPPEIDEN